LREKGHRLLFIDGLKRTKGEEIEQKIRGVPSPLLPACKRPGFFEILQTLGTPLF